MVLKLHCVTVHYSLIESKQEYIFRARPIVHSGNKHLLNKVNQTNMLGHLDKCWVWRRRRRRRRIWIKSPFEDPWFHLWGLWVNKMAYTAKDPCHPWCFMYLTDTKSWRCEGGEGENVHLLTHATARGMGKK